MKVTMMLTPLHPGMPVPTMLAENMLCSTGCTQGTRGWVEAGWEQQSWPTSPGRFASHRDLSTACWEGSHFPV